MGWMHDTLDYFEHEPDPPRLPPPQAHLRADLRRHREVPPAAVATTRSCTCKRALLSKMPGDDWQMLANLRALYGYMEQGNT